MIKLSHMVLPVSNLQKSRDWYVGKLGFSLEREHDGIVGIKDQSGLIIFLQPAAEGLAGDKITLTIQVDNVESKFKELESMGVQFLNPPNSFSGAMVLRFLTETAT